MAACRDGHLEIVKLLADNGADINAKNNNGGTALMFASHAGKLEVVKFLLGNDADANAKANNGMNALMVARNPEIRKILMNAMEAVRK